MIENKVTFDGEVIISIYHHQSDNCIYHEREIEDIIGGKSIIFTEKIVSDIDIADKVQGLTTIKGLVDSNAGLNPYNGGSIVANITHYMSYHKPQSIFNYVDGEYCLFLSIQDLQKILEFINTYCGIALFAYPMHLGDIFVTEPIELNVHSKRDESNNIQGAVFVDVPIESVLVVHFKKLDISQKSEYIVYSKMIGVEIDNSSIFVECPVQWDGMDVFVYQNNILIYKRENIYFMRSVHITMGIAADPIELQLSRFGNMSIPKLPSEESIVVGNPLINGESLRRGNQNIVKSLRNIAANSKRRLYSFHPTEEKLAREYIINQLTEAKDYACIIDAYFTDHKDDKVYDSIFDWLSILSHLSAVNKEIVYYVSRKDDGTSRALDYESLQQAVKQHRSTMDYYRQNNKIGIQCIETKTAIHDRFIFTQSEEDMVCSVIGTSLNSLSGNFYCIHRYEGVEAKEIFEDIRFNALKESNITVRELI